MPKPKRRWSLGEVFVVIAGLSLFCVTGFFLLVVLLAEISRTKGRPLTEAEKARARLDVANAVGAYDATTGAPINVALVSNNVVKWKA